MANYSVPKWSYKTERGELNTSLDDSTTTETIMIPDPLARRVTGGTIENLE